MSGKLALFTALAALALLPRDASAQNATVATEGATVGAWTHDYEAAVKLAAEKNLPLFLNFTGSDWCGWCKLMDKKVFSTDVWKDWAKDKIALAYINFPRNPDFVPKKFILRNDELQRKYGIRGYPTYIVVAPDGATVLGVLGASRDATPEGFIAELEQLLNKMPRPVKKAREDKKAKDKAKAEDDKAAAADKPAADKAAAEKADAQ